MMSAGLALSGFAFAFACSSCDRREPPTPDISPSVSLPEGLPPTVTTPVRVSPPPLPLPSVAATAGAPPAAPSDATFLSQTREVPKISGSEFQERVHALWDAIVSDDPQRAMPFFFPENAYQKVKDVPNPSADWSRRLVAAYVHDIHSLHLRLASPPDGAQLLGLEVPEDRSRWVEPGEEYNKVGYFRVFGSKLRYQEGGSTRTFDVKSLISWRGEWYVVHLSAIK